MFKHELVHNMLYKCRSADPQMCLLTSTMQAGTATPMTAGAGEERTLGGEAGIEPSKRAV
jgi:hypothetical protein